MKQMVTWCVVAGIHLACAACSNEAAPGTMMPGFGTAAGTGVLPGAAGALAMSAAGTGGIPTNPVPSGTAGTGVGPVTGAAGTPSVGTAGTGTAGTAAPIGGAAGSSAAGGTATEMPGAGAGGMMAATAGAGPEPSGFKPKCLAKGAELALIGDSWINYAFGELLAPRLEERAKRDGALAQGDRYNDQAVGGSSLASGGITPLIPTTWDPAKQAAERAGTTVKFVVMDGGGNDVLLGNTACLENGAGKAMDPACQKTVTDATLAGKMLQQRMVMDGVGQVIYFFYPHVPYGGWDMIDYSLPMAKETCESMNSPTYQCYFLDTREAFQGAGNNGVAKGEYIALDDIHPSAAGMELLGDLIWKLMKDKCMAQNASSGCCTP